MKELLEETCEQLFSAWRKDGQEGIRNKIKGRGGGKGGIMGLGGLWGEA